MLVIVCIVCIVCIVFFVSSLFSASASVFGKTKPIFATSSISLSCLLVTLLQILFKRVASEIRKSYNKISSIETNKQETFLSSEWVKPNSFFLF